MYQIIIIGGAYKTYKTKAAHLCFKTAVHCDNKRIIHKTHNISFRKHLSYLVPEHDVGFVNFFHGKSFSCIFMTD